MIFSRSTKGFQLRINDILFPNVHVFSLRPLFSNPVVCFVSAIPEAQEARIFGVATLLSKEKVYHF